MGCDHWVALSKTTSSSCNFMTFMGFFFKVLTPSVYINGADRYFTLIIIGNYHLLTIMPFIIVISI